MLPAVEAWSLNHWTAREVPIGYFTLYIHRTAQQHESLRQFSTIKIGLNVYLVIFTLKSHTEEVMTNSWLAMDVNNNEFYSPTIIRTTKGNYKLLLKAEPCLLI